MSNTRFTFLSAVHGLFFDGEKVLLSERKNTGYMDGYFSLPAGHVDGGETIASALRREVKEEIGVMLTDIPDPTHVMHRIISSTEERIDFFFIITSWSGDIINAEPDKCAQLIWVNKSNLPEKMVPYIRKAIEEIAAGNSFSEFDQ